MAPDTLACAWAQARRSADSLAVNGSYGFFAALSDAVVTGPTLTNVNSIRGRLVESQ